MMVWLLLIDVSPGQEYQDAPLLVPPLPKANLTWLPAPGDEATATLLPGQDAKLEALTEEEREQVFKSVDLDLKSPREFTIQTKPEVPLDEDDPSRGLIEPPPMQANSFDVVPEAVSLHLYGGDGVEYPFYTPVAPFCYLPLYFEDPCLERYGDAYCCPVQSVVSGVRFYSDIALLPYNMLSEPPCRPILNLWADPVDPAWEYTCLPW
jgi:hypothetical protein